MKDGTIKEIFNAKAYATDDINFYNVGHGCPIITELRIFKENS
jgi:hypothetical protein